jgi:epoxyqueuosine reductase QueG
MFEKELTDCLKELGASLIGFGDLSYINEKSNNNNNMNYGISIAVKLNSKVVEGIVNGATREYYDEYNKLNNILDKIANSCVKFITDKGYSAVGQTSTYITSDDDLTTPMPHKTVATRAGLGWIGKNALLVTPEYGSAIRLTSVITDMPLVTNNPINESKCGTCNKCKSTCPAKAINGNLWNVNSKREELLNPHACRKTARKLFKDRVGIEITLCGKCIEVCPYTQRYLNQLTINS